MGSRQRDRRDISDAGQDSFLDIVANIVGILIILVMVMGVRAKNAPIRLSVPSPQRQVAEHELQRELAAEQSLHRAVFETAAIASASRIAFITHHPVWSRSVVVAFRPSTSIPAP